MKKVEHYVCEVCGTEFNDKAKCLECEKGHCKALSIKRAKYLALRNAGTGYPASIDVEMSDGKTLTYKR